MLKIAVVCVLVAASMASPTGYGQSGQYQQQEVHETFSGRSTFDNELPQPYDFSYQSNDNSGNQQSRQESGDGNGNVRGSYGYTNVDGIARQVNYVADEGGFRATIQTNEPGTKSENPADVQIEANPVIVEEYEQQSNRYGQGINLRGSHLQSGVRSQGSYGGSSGGHEQQSHGSVGGQFSSAGHFQQNQERLGGRSAGYGGSFGGYSTSGRYGQNQERLGGRFGGYGQQRRGSFGGYSTSRGRYGRQSRGSFGGHSTSGGYGQQNLGSFGGRSSGYRQQSQGSYSGHSSSGGYRQQGLSFRNNALNNEKMHGGNYKKSIH